MPKLSKQIELELERRELFKRIDEYNRGILLWFFKHSLWKQKLNFPKLLFYNSSVFLLFFIQLYLCPINNKQTNKTNYLLNLEPSGFIKLSITRIKTCRNYDKLKIGKISPSPRYHVMVAQDVEDVG